MLRWAPSLLLMVMELAAFGYSLEGQTEGSPAMSSQSPFRHVSPEAVTHNVLNAKRVDDAEAYFKAILAKQEGNPGALAGMGFVRMKEGNFLGAISFFRTGHPGHAEG